MSPANRVRVAIAAAIAAGATLFLLVALLPALEEEAPGDVVAEAATAPAVRDVTPPGVLPAPAGDGPLVRIAGPEPEPRPPRWRRFFQPVAVTAASFRIAAGEIGLAGIVAPAADELCDAADGSAWPCGMAGRTAMRQMLRGRAIECLWPSGAEGPPTRVPCRVVEVDLALWAVTNGWARAAPDADQALRRAEEEARCGGRGVWRFEAAACAPTPPAN